MRFTNLIVVSLIGASVAAPVKRDETTSLSTLSSLYAQSVSGMQESLTLAGLLEDITALVGLSNVVVELEDATAGLRAELDDLTNVTAIIDEIHTLQMELAKDVGLYDLLTLLGNESGFFVYEAEFDHVVEALAAEVKYFLGIQGGNNTDALVGLVEALNSDVDTLLSELGVSEIDAALASTISSIVDALFSVPDSSLSEQSQSLVSELDVQTLKIMSAIEANSTVAEIDGLVKPLSATVKSLQASL